MITLLNQSDDRWRYAKLGNSRTATIGRYGCLLTCFAMLAGHDDPRLMNECRKRTGGFGVGEYGAYAADFDIVKCAPRVSLMYASPQFYYKAVPYKDQAAMRYALLRGQYLIIEVDTRGPGDWSAGHRDYQHFVTGVAVGVGEDIIIHDPIDGTHKSLLPRYGRTLSGATWRYFVYEVRG